MLKVEPNPERLVSRKEAARLLANISIASIRRLEKDDILPPVRLRRRGSVYFRLSDVLALIEKGSSDACR
jgi:hypothetical protein